MHNVHTSCCVDDDFNVFERREFTFTIKVKANAGAKTT